MSSIVENGISHSHTQINAVRYLNQYRCPYCQTEWEDVWDSGCNDRCPDCNKEIEPYESSLIDGESAETGSPVKEPIIVPKGDCSAQALQQMASFRSEYDEFQESTFESDSDAFIAFVVANTASDPANAMQRLLPNFCGCPALYGKAFVVELDQHGKPASVIAYPTESGQKQILQTGKDC